MIQVTWISRVSALFESITVCLNYFTTRSERVARVGYKESCEIYKQWRHKNVARVVCLQQLFTSSLMNIRPLNEWVVFRGKVQAQKLLRIISRAPCIALCSMTTPILCFIRKPLSFSFRNAVWSLQRLEVVKFIKLDLENISNSWVHEDVGHFCSVRSILKRV